MRGLGLALLFGVAAAHAAASQDVELWREVLEAFDRGDPLVISELVAVPGSEAETVSRYLDLERSLYWEGRRLEAAVFVAEQGIAYCLTRAALVADENAPAARQLRGAASRLAFNLASSTWPGWDEPGIEIRASFQQLGLTSARLALRLSEDLEAGPGALANGYWMVGAHELAAGSFDQAGQSFGRAALFARAASDRGTELVSEGFRELTRVAAGEDRDEAVERLGEIRQALESEVANPDFWTEQIDTARRVFLRD